MITVKPVLSGHSKIDQMNVFKTGGSLIQVESIAEGSGYSSGTGQIASEANRPVPDEKPI